LPERDAERYGQAIVGDTKDGSLCRARVYVNEDVVIDAEIEFIAAESPDKAREVLLKFLRGRAHAEVLEAVTARSCSSDGCSSVEGKCFNLMQEAVYRALGDFARKFETGAPQVLSTPAGGVDMTRQVVPVAQDDEFSLAGIEEWARARVASPEHSSETPWTGIQPADSSV
jgi:hypothetical protein